jgi:uncharacterized protein
LMERDRYCGSDFKVSFEIQTNGTLITPQWCKFFKRHLDKLWVGVSCDGPAFLHDANRRSWAGRSTHERTLRGMQLLAENNINFDIIAVVSPETLDHPKEFFEFFSSQKELIREFHFNLLDQFPFASNQVRDSEIYVTKYRKFLGFLLDTYKTAPDPVNTLKIRNFSAFYDQLFGTAEIKEQYSCRAASRPFKTLNIEANGDVSTFYAGITREECRDLYGDDNGLIIGNLLTQELDDIARSEKLHRISCDFEISHRACEAACDYFSLCSGGYNLIKYKRFGTFQATETPECLVHVKTFADVMLADMNGHISVTAR